MMFKVRAVEEDLEIVTLLLANLALALDNLENRDNLVLILDADPPNLHFGSIFKQFGSDLRKLQVSASGDRIHVIPSLDLDFRSLG